MAHLVLSPRLPLLFMLLCASLPGTVTETLSLSADGNLTEASNLSSTARTPEHHLPNYMMHLYRHFRIDRPQFLLKHGSLDSADTVRSVVAKSLFQRDKRWIATFDFSFLLSEERFMMAKLRIRIPRTIDIKDLEVEIKHHHEFPCQGSGMCHDHQSLGLLTGFSIIDSSRRWKVFSVTTLLFYWLKGKLESKETKPVMEHEDLPDLDLGPSTDSKVPNDRAVILVFSHAQPDHGFQNTASLLRTAEQSKFLSGNENKTSGGSKRFKRHKASTDQPLEQFKVPNQGDGMSLCHRVDLYIDFNYIGWGAWVISPKRYNAYRCEGICPNPVGKQFRPTNHAYIQSLLKSLHPDRVPPICCVPTKMSPMSMVYFEGGEMLVRHHEDMIVDECGCK